MAKYDPLETFLNSTPSHLNNIVFSFTQIEQILGTTLPPNAYNPKGTWWRNTRTMSRPQSRAWLSAGWKQDVVSWHEHWVRFRRHRENGKPPLAEVQKLSPAP